MRLRSIYHRAGAALNAGRDQMNAPVFGVGMNKTGTTSLQTALQYLGYRVMGEGHMYSRRLDHDAVMNNLKDMARYCDAFQDYPWFLKYQEIDETFPEAKFILTIRDTDSWIRSVQKYYSGYDRPSLGNAYGVSRAIGHEEEMIQAYERHNMEIIDYFRDRPEKLLVIDFSKEEGWGRLCDFLGKPSPGDRPLPQSNKAESLSCLAQRHFNGITRHIAYHAQKAMDISL